MPATLTINTLGRFEITLDHRALPWRMATRRPLLLVCLAACAAPQPRKHLAGLLWPRVENALAMASLRTLLRDIHIPGAPDLVCADRNLIYLNPALAVDFDVIRLREAAARLPHISLPELQAAVDTYLGAFLSTVSLDTHPAIDEWATTIRAEMEIVMVLLLGQLVRLLLESRRDPRAAVKYASQLIELAPGDEDAQAQAVRALAANGQVAEALQRLRDFERVHSAEFSLNTPLSGKWRTLAEQLARPNSAARLVVLPQPGRPPKGATPPDEPDAAPWLPANLSPFFGREHEQAMLHDLLDKGHRLISIVGLGGVGKSSLVRSQLPGLCTRFPASVFFADLRQAGGAAAGDPVGRLLATIAAALRLHPAADLSLLDQVVSELDKGARCLILDNFVTSLPAALALLQIMQSAPALSVIITSRARLNLAGETVLPLSGLPVPHLESDAASAAGGDPSPAVQLFEHSARKILPGFALTSSNRQQIASLCRQLGGLPLAIQLAAMQCGFYGLDDLLALTVSNLALLAGEQVDLDGEQRSIEAMLWGTWATISPAAQRALAQMSVFANNWSRVAMATVAPASRTLYGELINASLLQIMEPGWFSLHPLVRQFAARRLEEEGAVDTDGQAAGSENELAARRHADYFLSLLDLGERLLERSRSLAPATYQIIQRCQADLLQAWRWAADHGMWPEIERAIVSFAEYMGVSGQIREGLALLQLLLDRLPHPGATPQQRRLEALATVLIDVLRTARQDPAIADMQFQRGLALVEQAGSPWDVAAAYAHHGHTLLSFSARFEEGLAYLRRAAHAAARHGFSELEVQVKSSMNYQAIFLGQWAEFRSLDAEIWLLTQQMQVRNNRLLISTCEAPMFLDDWPEAERRIADWEAYLQEKSTYDMMHPWIDIFRAEVLAARGELDTAIATLQMVLPGFAARRPATAPMAWGELSIFQARAGDRAAALRTAAHTIQSARAVRHAILRDQALVHAAVAISLTGDTALASSILAEALETGLEAPNAALAFTALYHLAMLYQADLPQALNERLNKIAAVCPAMYYGERPLARECCAAQRITVSETEYDRLWATDLAEIRRLAREVKDVLRSR